MKIIASGLLMFIYLLLPAASHAGFDIEQEVLTIPDYHDIAAYEWKVERNPKGFGFTFAPSQSPEGTNHELDISIPADRKIEEMHVFMTNKALDIFEQFIPQPGQRNKYKFTYAFPEAGSYYFEVALRTGKGWVNLSKKVEIEKAAFRAKNVKSLEDQGYEIKIKHIPSSAVWTQHVTTLVFEIFLNGKPVHNLESIQGSDMHLFAWKTFWFKKVGHFEYATSRQNLGGPEVGVSLVFKKTGRYKIFAQFKHLNTIHTIQMELDVGHEPQKGDDDFQVFRNNI